MQNDQSKNGQPVSVGSTGGSAARAAAARMEDALRQIEDLVGRCVSNPGLESNVVEMVAKLADRHDALRELAIAAGDFVHNIEHQHVTGGAAVRDDGCYMRLRGVTTRAGFYSPNNPVRDADRRSL